MRIIDEAHQKLHEFMESNYHEPDYVLIPETKLYRIKEEINLASAINMESKNGTLKLFGVKVIETPSIDEIIYCYDKRH